SPAVRQPAAGVVLRHGGGAVCRPGHGRLHEWPLPPPGDLARCVQRPRRRLRQPGDRRAGPRGDTVPRGGHPVLRKTAAVIAALSSACLLTAAPPSPPPAPPPPPNPAPPIPP